jgi:hypothetical protein
LRQNIRSEYIDLDIVLLDETVYDRFVARRLWEPEEVYSRIHVKPCVKISFLFQARARAPGTLEGAAVAIRRRSPCQAGAPCRLNDS